MEQEDAKKVRKEICERWKSLGLTEGLSGKRLENVVELFESEAKKLLRTPDPDEQPDFPKITVIKQKGGD